MPDCEEMIINVDVMKEIHLLPHGQTVTSLT